MTLKDLFKSNAAVIRIGSVTSTQQTVIHETTSEGHKLLRACICSIGGRLGHYLTFYLFIS